MRPARVENALNAPSVALALAVALLAMPAMADSGWVDVPLPEGSRVQWVTTDMRYNGLSMQAYRFQLKRPMAEVVDFYRRDRRERLVENKLGAKTVLGYKQDAYFVTIELMSSGGSTQGQVGIMKLPVRKPAPAGQSFAKPGGTRVYEEIVYRDVPGHPVTLRMGNAMSPFQNQQFYRRKYLGAGYVDAGAGDTCKASSTTCVAYYQKGDRQISITAFRESRETVLMVINKG